MATKLLVDQSPPPSLPISASAALAVVTSLDLGKAGKEVKQGKVERVGGYQEREGQVEGAQPRATTFR